MPPDPGGRNRLSIVGALGIFEIFAWGTSFNLLTVLAGPIAQDTGWALTWVVGGFTVSLLVAAAAAPYVGALIARRGGRPVLAGASLLFAAGHGALAIAPSLPLYLAGWMLLGLGMACGLYDAAFATLSQVFGSQARMPVTAVTLLGGFATTLCWPLSGVLVAEFGWRWACAAYAGLHLALTLPLVLLAIPAVRGQTLRAAGPMRRPEALPAHDRTAFVLLAAILPLTGAILSTVTVHLLTLLQTHGMAMASAIAAAALIGPAKVGARMIEIAGRGRHHPLWTLTAAAGAIALGLLLVSTGLPGMGAWLALYGSGNGLASIARSTVPLALFGAERYPVLGGRLARPIWIAQGFAPSLGALLVTWAGAEALWSVLIVLGFVNCGLVGILWRIRRA